MARQFAEGGCLCGAVRFRIALPTLWCAHCHCEYCRQAHGAAFVTFVGVPEGQFHLTAGELVRYRHTPESWRAFCGTCGSTLCFGGDRWPGEVHVARAGIEGEIDRRPEAHAYYDRRVDWVEPADTLPRLGRETGTEPAA